jgi:hypothetical protein
MTEAITGRRDDGKVESIELFSASELPGFL